MADPIPISNPVLPVDFSDNIPKAGGGFCGKLHPAIINFITKFSAWYSWFYDENGFLSADATREICQLPCLGTGTGGTTSSCLDPIYAAAHPEVCGGGGTCPNVFLTGEVTENDQELVLNFSGDNLVAGYGYELFLMPDEVTVINSGVTTGSTISITKTGLANNVEYSYKLVVQKAGCDPYDVTVIGAPSECKSLSLFMEVFAGTVETPQAEGVLTIRVRAGVGTVILSSFDYELYMSTDGGLGSLIASGTVGAVVSGTGVTLAQCNVNGALALCGAFTGTWPNRYYFTMKMREKAACSWNTLTGNAVPSPGTPGIPFLRIMNGVLQWANVPNAGIYRIWGYGIGHDAPNGGQAIGFGQANPNPTGTNVFPINTNQLCCTVQGTSGQPGAARYRFYVEAINAVGIRNPSNEVQFDTFNCKKCS